MLTSTSRHDVRCLPLMRSSQCHEKLKECKVVGRREDLRSDGIFELWLYHLLGVSLFGKTQTF